MFSKRVGHDKHRTSRDIEYALGADFPADQKKKIADAVGEAIASNNDAIGEDVDKRLRDLENSIKRRSASRN